MQPRFRAEFEFDGAEQPPRERAWTINGLPLVTGAVAR